MVPLIVQSTHWASDDKNPEGFSAPGAENGIVGIFPFGNGIKLAFTSLKFPLS